MSGVYDFACEMDNARRLLTFSKVLKFTYSCFACLKAWSHSLSTC